MSRSDEAGDTRAADAQREDQQAMELWVRWLEATKVRDTLNDRSGDWQVSAKRNRKGGALSCTYKKEGSVEGTWSGPSPDLLSPAVRQGATPPGLKKAIISVLRKHLSEITTSSEKTKPATGQQRKRKDKE